MLVEHDRLRDTGRTPDPGRRDEQERAYELGPAVREPERDETAEGVARDDGGTGLLCLEHGSRDSREVGGRGAARQRSGASVARQIERDHPVALHQVRQQLDPVSGRAGEPMEEEQRLTLRRRRNTAPTPASWPEGSLQPSSGHSILR